MHNFLSKEECAAIVDIARCVRAPERGAARRELTEPGRALRDKMGRSTIAESGSQAKNGVGEARTSSTAWLTKGVDPIVNRIRQRVPPPPYRSPYASPYRSTHPPLFCIRQRARPPPRACPGTPGACPRA